MRFPQKPKAKKPKLPDKSPASFATQEALAHDVTSRRCGSCMPSIQDKALQGLMDSVIQQEMSRLARRHKLIRLHVHHTHNAADARGYVFMADYAVRSDQTGKWYHRFRKLGIIPNEVRK